MCSVSFYLTSPTFMFLVLNSQTFQTSKQDRCVFRRLSQPVGTWCETTRRRQNITVSLSSFKFFFPQGKRVTSLHDLNCSPPHRNLEKTHEYDFQGRHPLVNRSGHQHRWDPPAEQSTPHKSCCNLQFCMQVNGQITARRNRGT